MSSARRLLSSVLLALGIAGAVAASGSGGARAAPPACAVAPPAAADVAAAMSALRARQDVWGDALLAAAERPDVRGRRAASRPAALRARARRRSADGLGRLLPSVRPAGRPAGSGVGGAARRRRERDPRAPGRRPVARGVRRCIRRRAVRLVSRPAGAGGARRRVPADPRDVVRRRRRRPLRPGVLRGPPSGISCARQPRPADGRRARGVARREHPARVVRRRLGRDGRGRPRRHDDRLRRLAGDRVRAADGDDRCGGLRRRPRGRRALLAATARGRDERVRSRAARRERLARAADPGPRAHVALQHRQCVRGVLVPRRPRRRAGDGGAGLRAGGALDPRDVADAAVRPLRELEARRAAAGVRVVLPPDSRPRVHRRGDARAAALRGRARQPDRRLEVRAARRRALFVGHSRLGARPPYADRRLGGAARDGERLGRDGARLARRDVAAPGDAPRSRAAASRPLVGAAAGRRLAVPPRAAARRGEAVRLARRGAPRQLLEPRRPVRARVRVLRARRDRGGGRLAVHDTARVAAARARPCRCVRVVRAVRAVPGLRDGRGLRQQRLPVPRRQRSRRPARPQPLRRACGGDDAEHVRRRRGREHRTAEGRALPLDVPAAERREQRHVPRDAPPDARPRDARRRG